MTPAEKVIIDSEIASMLHQNVIEPVPNSPESGEYISNIFLRKKKDGGYRVILNLKTFNKFVQKSHFKMTSLQSAIELMSPHAYMASVDFKSAYYSISINKLHRKYLRFMYGGRKYQFRCLPFGLTTGPCDFTKVVKTLFRVLRDKGHLNSFYLDDSFLVHHTYSGCLRNVLDTITLSRDLGFTINPAKSVLFPTQELVFLGFVLNSVSMTVRLTPDKISHLIALITNVLQRQCCTILQIAELVGKLVSTFPAVPHGKLFYRQLDIDKTDALRESHGDFSNLMHLSEQARFDLQWWCKHLPSSHTKIQSKNPDFLLRTDASNYGHGSCLGDKTFSGQWNYDEIDLHINVKELLAIFYGLQHLCSDCTDCNIKIETDNTTALTYINNMGGKITSCNRIARNIWDWAISHNVWLLCSFIPGKFNIQADQLSRQLNETTEWSLSADAFYAVRQAFPEISIDLFASCLNYKLPRYVTWFSDKNATFCDAFSLDWSKFFAYAFPPFNLIGRVVQKVELDKCDMVIIVPEWRSQYWFTKVCHMSVTTPLILPRNGRALINPLNDRAAKITSRLIAFKISGSTQKPQAFPPASGH